MGRTNGLNPIALILPCHRVIGKDGSLTRGFAGGLEPGSCIFEARCSDRLRSRSQGYSKRHEEDGG
ncbi:MAG: MGMT family protein [Geminicoccaceae bacterium]